MFSEQLSFWEFRLNFGWDQFINDTLELQRKWQERQIQFRKRSNSSPPLLIPHGDKLRASWYRSRKRRKNSCTTWLIVLAWNYKRSVSVLISVLYWDEKRLISMEKSEFLYVNLVSCWYFTLEQKIVFTGIFANCICFRECCTLKS